MQMYEGILMIFGEIQSGSCHTRCKKKSNVLYVIEIVYIFDTAQSFKADTTWETVLAAALQGTVHYVAETLFQESNYSLG